MRSRSTSRPANAGFTLVEIVVVTALFGMLLAVGLLLSMDVLRGTTFRSTRDVLVSTLSNARGRALANLHQSSHGACYDAPDFVLFRGATYDEDMETNERVPGNEGVALSSDADAFSCDGGGGIVFSQLAATTSGGRITVSGEGHRDETVEVNAAGGILW